MKTLKHQSKGTIAVITDTTVYLAMLDGTIIKHFPPEHFKDSSYTEEVIFPVDFNTAKNEYNQRNESKKEANEKARQQAAEIAKNERAEKLNNLWKWRKGLIEAFRIFTVDIPVETFNKNPSYEGVWDNVFFSTLDEAEQKAESLIGSWDPEFDDSPNNVIGEVSLYQCNIPLKERRQITTLDDLEDYFEEIENYFKQGDLEPIFNETFAKQLPEKCIIVNMSEHRGRFNNKYYKPYALFVEGDNLGSRSNWRKAEDYSSLWGEQVFENLYDYVEKFSDDENAINLIRSTFTREDAVNTYGLDESQAEWIYAENVN